MPLRHGGVEVYLHAVLTLALHGDKWSALHANQLLYLQGKSPWYRYDRKFDRLHSWSGLGKEKNSLPLK
jgi:hypothetical protein